MLNLVLLFYLGRNTTGMWSSAGESPESTLVHVNPQVTGYTGDRHKWFKMREEVEEAYT
jgi:hypothetical protein